MTLASMYQRKASPKVAADHQSKYGIKWQMFMGGASYKVLGPTFVYATVTKMGSYWLAVVNPVGVSGTKIPENNSFTFSKDFKFKNADYVEEAKQRNAAQEWADDFLAKAWAGYLKNMKATGFKV